MADGMLAAQFTTDILPRQVRYDAWRQLISAVFEPTMPNGHARKLCKRPNTVVVASRSAAPQELGLSRDPRVFGVAIRRLLVRHGPLLATMAAGDPQMADGFHAFEPELGLRWTDGRGVVPAALFDGMDGETELAVVVTSTARYCADDHAAA